VTKCEECRKKEIGVEQEVREYVREHPGVSMQEVSNLFGISRFKIRQMIRRDLIQFADDSVIKLACEGCGAPIIGGRYCDKCLQTVGKGGEQPSRSRLADIGGEGRLIVDPKHRDKDAGKMRYLDKGE